MISNNEFINNAIEYYPVGIKTVTFPHISSFVEQLKVDQLKVDDYVNFLQQLHDKFIDEYITPEALYITAATDDALEGLIQFTKASPLPCKNLNITINADIDIDKICVLLTQLSTHPGITLTINSAAEIPKDLIDKISDFIKKTKSIGFEVTLPGAWYQDKLQKEIDNITEERKLAAATKQLEENEVQKHKEPLSVGKAFRKKSTNDLEYEHEHEEEHEHEH